MNQTPPAFAGFSLPDGAWLPPELMHVLPSMNLAELKITIAAIYETMQVAGRGSTISLTDFEALTGLSRKSVLRGIRTAVKRGSITRTQAAGTFIYRLAVHSTSGYSPHAGGGKSTPPAAGYSPRSVAEGEASTPPTSGFSPLNGGKSTPIGGKSTPIGGKSTPIGGKNPPHDMYACSTYPSSPEPLHAASGESTPPEKDTDPALIAEMRALGVALKVCQNIAGRYEDSYIIQKLRHARHALEAGLAHNPAGWFVTAIKDDWPAPLGYDEEAHLTDEERSRRYITGEYSDLIQH